MQMHVPEGTTSSAIPFNEATWSVIAALTAVTWYNVFELNVQIYLAFKRRSGLYFWSLVITSYGCVFHALGFLLKFLGLCNIYLSCTIITIGWYAMVTGQSVVLYSRLHLVVRNSRTLHLVLAMICIDAVVFHVPTTILTFGINTSNAAKYLPVFKIYERLQMTAFCLQEIIISGIYVWSTIALLQPLSVSKVQTRSVMMKLIWINLIIIGLDAALLGMEYASFYTLETTMKGPIYSIKLKLEFAVLNQLMTLATRQVKALQNLQADKSGGDLTEPIKTRNRSIEYTSTTYVRRQKQEARKRQQQREHRRLTEKAPLPPAKDSKWTQPRQNTPSL